MPPNKKGADKLPGLWSVRARANLPHAANRDGHRVHLSALDTSVGLSLFPRCPLTWGERIVFPYRRRSPLRWIRYGTLTFCASIFCHMCQK